MGHTERSGNQNIEFATMSSHGVRANTMPTYVYTYANDVFAPSRYLPQSGNWDNRLISNGVGKVNDIIHILPSFDPNDNSLSSVQFVGRVEQLLHVYEWNEKLLLFAVQAKLKGAAKMWIDSAQIVYVNWSHFVKDFLDHFPSVINSADVHIELMNMRRG